MIGNGIDCSLKELVKVINLFDQCDYNKGGRDNKLWINIQTNSETAHTHYIHMIVIWTIFQ